jgi:hypothetical protein
MNIDQNLMISDADTVDCRSCGRTLGTRNDPLAGAIRREQPSTAAGPGVRANPSLFTDSEIVLRQTFCPECLTLLSTEIVPKTEPNYRGWRLSPVLGAE